MLLQIDGTFIVIGISFIIFMGIMHFLFYAPIFKVKKERAGYIEENERHAQAMSDTAEQYLEVKENELKHTRTLSKEIMSKAVQKANSKKQATIKEATDKASATLAEAKGKIAESKSQTKESLRGEVSSLAEDIVSKILD